MQPNEAVYEALIQQLCLMYDVEGAQEQLTVMTVSWPYIHFVFIECVCKKAS